MLVAATERLVVGDLCDPGTDVGTLIDEPTVVRVERRVAEAVDGGARVPAGGRRRGAQFWPTMLDHVDRAAPLVCEETFAPCAPLVRVKDLDDAVDYLDAGRVGLQAAVFTRRIDEALRAARESQVGAVIINAARGSSRPTSPSAGSRTAATGVRACATPCGR